jgi:CRP/FNR family transcriptional regulator, dissimilatory nitrate respiration regulator
VKVFKLSAEGKEQILHIFGVGDHFAKVLAMDGECFPTSAAAIDPAEVLFFPRKAFLELLEQGPTLAINMLRSFARHLRHFSHLINILVLSEVPTRLAIYLLNLSEQFEQANMLEIEFPDVSLAKTLLQNSRTNFPQQLKR